MADALWGRKNLYCDRKTSSETFRREVIRTKFGVPTAVELTALGAIDQWHAEGKSLDLGFQRMAQSLRAYPVIHESMVSYPTKSHVFSGGVLTPFHALAHSISGKGEPVIFPVGSIGLNVKLPSVRPFMDAVNAKGKGVHKIDVKFTHDVRKDSLQSGWALGNITLRVVGNVKVAEDGAWIFDGELRAYDDLYDANASTHRDWIGESATSFLRSVMQTPYTIKMPGVISVKAGGQ
ncbi:lipid II-degrading bacteriocin [Pseudomonas sp. MAFF212428]|uniref:Lipid II-degrading bacteriocin n=3 Tax=Pseudomonas brassicae TaxID=2708063 RepID=A0A6M0CWF5_9PSED|nr:lipid II-degrading bacteriocin [Pseudomonas brassicae]